MNAESARDNELADDEQHPPDVDLEAYRPGGLLLTAVTALLGLNIAVNLVAIASDGMEILLLQALQQGIEVPQDRIEANDNRQMIIGASYLMVFLVLAVVFLRSLYVLNHNARALGADDMTTSPGWTVGWFFIPFANLFKPFQAVRDIWKASVPAVGPWQENHSSPLVGWWWGLFIASGALGRLVFNLSNKAETVEEFIVSDAVNISSCLVDIVLSAVAMAMLRRLFAMQEQRLSLFRGETAFTESRFSHDRFSVEDDRF